MNDHEEEKDKGQKSWLKEHESLQVELLKMKDELMSELDSGPKKGQQRRPAHPPEEPPSGTISQKSAQDEQTKARRDTELTIKQMLGGTDQAQPKEGKKETTREPPRLQEGTIPTSPDLTSKIASVLQLEDKLKRRKFELEKRSRGKEIPPPPTRPVLEEGTVVKEEYDGSVEGTHEIELTRYAASNDEQLEEIEEFDTEEIEEQGEQDAPEGTMKEKESAQDSEGDSAEAKAKTEKRSRGRHHEERKKKRRGIWALFGRG
ncbi:MAG: hypothetical protein ACMUHY_04130 [Thermoplasmatota archaeon]